MSLNLLPLKEAFNAYVASVTNPELSAEDRRIDLKHMHFWYPYYAAVVTSVAAGEKPQVEKRTLNQINTQSQIDYEHLSNEQLLANIQNAQATVVKLLPKIPVEELIPYKRGSNYTPEKYADVLITHLKMHYKYLDERAGKS